MAPFIGLGIAAALASSPSIHAQPTDPPGVLEDGVWNEVFTRDGGWNGGDIGHSIDLGDGRTLWLFGDSIVGPVRNGSRVGGESKMVRGAIAWHKTPRQGEAPEAVHFAVPDPGLVEPEVEWIRPEADLFGEGAWLWLMGDGLVVRGDEGRDRFVLFATAIGPAGNPEGMWDFRRLGGAILSVKNPGDAPDTWRVEQRVNPLVSETAKFGEPAQEGENWGLAVVAWPSGGAVGPRTLYVYGLRSGGPGDNRLLVARCSEGELDAPGAWRFWDGAAWGADAGQAAPIADGLVDEFTIEPVRREGEDELVLIQSEPMLGRHVLARASPAPEGPWSDPRALYEVSGVGEDPRLLTYAAKGHARLSEPGTLLVSTVVNSPDLGRVFRDAGLYRPRFVAVPLGLLPRARGGGGSEGPPRRP
ncbi:MAG: hypothetical protein IPJ41_06470 [Phycisphaerales bacterium]|nr:hypothetical protein [Phycisphaerales bacterium]